MEPADIDKAENEIRMLQKKARKTQKETTQISKSEAERQPEARLAAAAARAGCMPSSSGSAIVAPRPCRNVRRGIVLKPLVV